MPEKKEDSQTEDRRPISARNTGWAAKIAGALARSGITPNQISFMSMIFGFIAFGLLYWFGAAFIGSENLWHRAWPLIAAIIAIQLRLLCNLFDGMVAIEGGKGGADGPFWNEFPDRAADMAILAGAGYAALNSELGWIAGGLAIFVAYVRELGRANGLAADFSGPMAKPHRMVVLCFGLLAAAFEPMWTDDYQILTITLWVIIAGCIITIIRRAARQINGLKSKN